MTVWAIIWDIQPSGETPWLITLLLGLVGLVTGLVAYGTKIYKAIGPAQSAHSPTVRFAIGKPISLDHCKLGSEVMAGLAEGRGITWSFQKVWVTWLVTFPATGVISALVMRFAMIVLDY